MVRHTYIGKSKKYKNVYSCYYIASKNRIGFYGQVAINGRLRTKHCFWEERDAAKWVDLQLIREGKEPRNILKKK